MDPVRQSHRRPVRALVFGLAPIVALAGCSGSGGTTPPNTGDGAQQAATALAAALSKGDVSTLPWSGLTGAQAQTEFRSVTSGLGSAKLTATSTRLTPAGMSAAATFTLSWTLPGVAQPWTYPVTAQLTEGREPFGSRSGRRPRFSRIWSPARRLSLTRTQGKRGDILAGDGSALMTERDVRRIGIDKTLVSGDAALTSAAKLAKLVDVDRQNFSRRSEERRVTGVRAGHRVPEGRDRRSEQQPAGQDQGGDRRSTARRCCRRAEVSPCPCSARSAKRAEK